MRSIHINSWKVAYVFSWATAAFMAIVVAFFDAMLSTTILKLFIFAGGLNLIQIKLLEAERSRKVNCSGQ